MNGTAENTAQGSFSDETNQVDLSGRWGSVLSGPYLAGEIDYGWSSVEAYRVIQLASAEEAVFRMAFKMALRQIEWVGGRMLWSGRALNWS
ncbi:hypothetical protein HHS34_005685 [Acidithiobacillus montserratensis]|uniref:Uncharacterized protein n=1 Tax=Acidithiobacillus montserratensis TaxID=2729135 RepID=A0ACD5HID6_9PROT|nr:hypothetical protein [Acidithiobacillus montserratensis]MBU2748643.1 hypothetical protein [Acidithiobacillus montserratensis]